jgi:hypothetical protein
MTTRDDAVTTRMLRELDPADSELTRAQRRRAATTLERILATDPEGPAPTAVAPGRGPLRRPRLLAGAVLTALAATVLVPMAVGGGEAFASWSSTPTKLDGEKRSAALAACLVLQGSDDGQLALDPAAPAATLLAEARGGWTYLIFTTTGSSGRKLEGSCLVPDDLVAAPRPGEGGFFGGLGRADELGGRPPANGVVREDTNGVGAVDDAMFVFAEGRAGIDVAGIEVTTPDGRQVEASIEHGRWAVWWPVNDDSGDSPEMTEAHTYEVTLSDGSVTRPG